MAYFRTKIRSGARSGIGLAALLAGLSALPAHAADTAEAAAETADAAAEAADDASAAADDSREDGIFVVGTRRGTRVLEAASLIDLVSREELDQGGAITLQQSLFRISPSFNFPQGSAARVGGGATRSASLRGQNPDLTLVLVNGKRRHGSVATGGTFPYGGAGYADINAIPLAAISRVEVLLDGASAQYGSDAIAGVLNLGLRENDSGGGLTATLGTYKKGDGETGALSGWIGTSLGGRGFLNVSADYSRRGSTDRSGPDIRPRYFRIADDGSLLPTNSTAGTADPREPYGRDRVGQWGNGQVEHLAVLANFGYDLTDQLQAYGWVNYANTNTRSWVNPQVPSSPSNIRAIFPDGFQVVGEYYDDNYSAVGGLKYDAGASGRFDLSLIYGRHARDTHNFNLVSPSYGLDSKTDLYSGQVTAEQFTSALDYDLDIDAGLARPIALQAGIAFRHERWWISKIGEEQSWNHGGVPILDGSQAGQPAGWGGTEQGNAPWDVTSGNRQVFSGYIGADFHLTDKLLVEITGRGEHYSDFGWTATGKFSARYDISPALALRGTVSNGYHAPSVGQLAYQSSGYAGTWNHSGITPEPNRTRQVTPGSTVARALGGGPLEPEKALNISAGFVLRPIENASLTVDVYQIDVDNRIVTTQALTGAVVEAATAAAGIPDYKSITFFTNGLDTRTRGVDTLARYGISLGQDASLDLSGGFSLYDTTVQRVRANTVSSVALFQRNVILNPELGTPEYKIVLGADLTVGKFSASLNQLFYGKYTYVHPTNAANDEVYGAKGYTNIEATYRLTDSTRVTVGANNVFDTYPAQFIAANQVNGINRYSFIHPEGANGAYYYARLAVDF
ncbi:TonB-dependent receptor plug domain-containing protein [Croceibacterium xixiisoli]|nr:TonB-dependent receptor [Croceibacterium xixiisoli]